jgi:hypothetical protein
VGAALVAIGDPVDDEVRQANLEVLGDTARVVILQGGSLAGMVRREDYLAT